MDSYESPKAYIIWDSEIGCVKEDITNWYFDKEMGKFKERHTKQDKPGSEEGETK